MTELKPCPFCGGEAERVELTDEDNFGGSVICCKKCGASSPVHFDRKENLDSSWNDRTLRTDFPAEDFSHTAEILRGDNDKLVRATLSNNINIIIAALDFAARA